VIPSGSWRQDGNPAGSGRVHPRDGPGRASSAWLPAQGLGEGGLRALRAGLGAGSVLDLGCGPVTTLELRTSSSARPRRRADVSARFATLEHECAHSASRTSSLASDPPTARARRGQPGRGLRTLALLLARRSAARAPSRRARAAARRCAPAAGVPRLGRDAPRASRAGLRARGRGVHGELEGRRRDDRLRGTRARARAALRTRARALPSARAPRPHGLARVALDRRVLPRLFAKSGRGAGCSPRREPDAWRREWAERARPAARRGCWRRRWRTSSCGSGPEPTRGAGPKAEASLLGLEPAILARTRPSAAPAEGRAAARERAREGDAPKRFENLGPGTSGIAVVGESGTARSGVLCSPATGKTNRVRSQPTSPKTTRREESST
jgi:hypothetical protein